ncbi:hypothetical protein [Maridesulfovibrio bastinii]|jgi:hypothetical protein|uniref:hypothetical protein n=1 Tax=Maridesulfovibrio bastinii TaxID=47157 RepID=UPI000417539A|nr:hypothetical protein [Maridesulfovibrio bastinii]
MSTITSQSELTKKAINWITEEFQNTGKPWNELIEKASMNFNLSPKDVEFVKRFFRGNETFDPCNTSRS